MKTSICMLLILMAMSTTFGCAPESDSQPDPPQPVETIIYLIRHAEKADNSANPNLSPDGLERANNWAVILQDATFAAFYSTNYNRTLQTIQPTATNNGQEVIIYDPANLSLQNVVSVHKGKKVFVVGHSNTVPQMINAYLGSQVYPNMEESEYGNLYKITVVDGVVSHEMSVHN